MKKLFYSISLLIIFSFFLEIQASSEKKRVFYINSYHSGYFWNDGIEKAIKDTLEKSEIPILFKKIEMNTKRRKSESYKLKISQKVKSLIDEFKPDIVITSDDNAAKYVIVPYFKNSSLPFIFCGVNGSAKKYGFPAKNVTGMIEVQLIPQLIGFLKKYTKGSKIGYLREDTLSSRIESVFFEEQLKVKIEKKFISSIDEWKKSYLDMQNSVDILLLGNFASIADAKRRDEEMVQFVKENTKIVTAGWDAVMSNKTLLVYSTVPEEQGEWAAKTALEVLRGKDITTIPIVKNEKANIFINTTLAKKLNIIFPFDFIDNAELRY